MEDYGALTDLVAGMRASAHALFLGHTDSAPSMAAPSGPEMGSMSDYGDDMRTSADALFCGERDEFRPMEGTNASSAVEVFGGSTSDFGDEIRESATALFDDGTNGNRIAVVLPAPDRGDAIRESADSLFHDGDGADKPRGITVKLPGGPGKSKPAPSRLHDKLVAVPDYSMILRRYVKGKQNNTQQLTMSLMQGSPTSPAEGKPQVERIINDVAANTCVGFQLERRDWGPEA